MNRRWYSISLASLLGLVAVICIWLSRETNRVRRQRQAVAVVERLCADRWITSYDSPFVRGVVYDCELTDHDGVTEYDPFAEPGAPVWLREALGDDYFRRITTVDLTDTSATDSDLESLYGIRSLERIALNRTRVTASGVKRLQQALPACQIDWTAENDIVEKLLPGMPR
ncbi:MAG: hypothetical protein QGG36_07875 [Pirellulaceae bacterium]|jgi:hypothetical protein|nr:hypothetical protein [Pirellulaceae bacterium]MDP7015702.1 hypothetical protein [Pirellulaceae bacterium]